MLKDIKAKLKDIRAKFSIGYRKLWKWHDNFEKNQIETLELKNTIIEMKIMVQSESRLDNEKTKSIKFTELFIQETRE